jgi:hypothetical protein
MKESLLEQLVRDNPELFEHDRFEMSIGNGWYNIVSALMGIISSPVDRARYRLNWEKEHPTDDGGTTLSLREAEVNQALAELPKIRQVKEKFGGLRFYYDGGDDKLYGAVMMAEAMASKTCEVCGRPGERRGGDWIQTLCDTHYNQQQEHDKARKEGRRLPAINYDEEGADGE